MFSLILLSIGILLLACIASIIRVRHIRQEYYPFLWVLWLGLVNMVLSSIVLTYVFRVHNYISSNVYALLELLLLLELYRRLGTLKLSNIRFRGMLVLYVLIFLIDGAFFHVMHQKYVSYFNVVANGTLIFHSINSINQVLLVERDPLRNSHFLISVALLIFFTYALLLEIFWIYGEFHNIYFGGAVFGLIGWVNIVCNFIFLLAVLWMQKRKTFTLQF